MSIAKLLPPQFKTQLRVWRRRGKKAWVRRFHPFTADQLLATLRRLRVRTGEVLMVHSTFDRFEGFEGGVVQVIRVLQNAVGAEGALLMPTLPFSGSAVDYAASGAITDIARTPSLTGIITEVFRRSPGVTRSIHPTHPVTGWGKRAAELLEDHYLAQTPCGRGSPFYRLIDTDASILFAGIDIRVLTFFHCVEELLEPQMPFSPFTQQQFHLQTRGADGRIYETTTRLFDPKIAARRNLEILVPYLRDRDYWREARVGLLRLLLLRAREVHETLSAMAAKGIYCYRGTNE